MIGEDIVLGWPNKIISSRDVATVFCYAMYKEEELDAETFYGRCGLIMLYICINNKSHMQSCPE